MTIIQAKINELRQMQDERWKQLNEERTKASIDKARLLNKAWWNRDVSDANYRHFPSTFIIGQTVDRQSYLYVHLDINKVIPSAVKAHFCPLIGLDPNYCFIEQTICAGNPTYYMVLKEFSDRVFPTEI